MGGFSYPHIEVTFPEKCPEKDHFLWRLSAILSRKGPLADKWQEWVLKCFPDQTTSAMMSLSRDTASSAKDLEAHLKSHGFTGPQRRSVLNLFAKWKQPNFRGAYFLELANEVLKSTPKEIQKNRRLLKKLTELEKTFTGRILLAHFAAKGGNDAWARRLIRPLLNIDPTQLAFQVNRRSFQAKEELEGYRRTLFILVQKLVEGPLRGELAALFLNKLDLFFDDAEFKALKDSSSAQFSLNFIRSQMFSHSWGAPYIGLWFGVLYHRTYETEYNKYLQDVFEPQRIEDLGEDGLWLLRHWFPSDHERREAVFRVLETALKTKDHYTRYQLIELSGIDAAKRFLSSKDPNFKRPAFQLSHQFYTELLEEGHAPMLALYKLYKLGERSDELLWSAAAL